MSGLAHHPDVIHTDLEEGAVLLHMGTGYYYSLDPVGVAIWREVPRAEGVEQLGRALARSFEVEPEAAAAAARAFLARLEEEELVVPATAAVAGTGGDGAASPAGSERGKASRRPFAEPRLLKHEEPLTKMVTHPFDPQLPLAE